MASLKETLTALADAIRKRSGKTEKMTLAEMPAEVAAIPAGGRDDELISGDFKDGTYENDSVTKIKDYAFCGVKTLTSISCENVYSVGLSAFSGARYLKKINFPNLSNAQNSAFDNTQIESVDLGKLKSVSNSMFNNCQQLKKVSCRSATKVGDSAFQFCGALQDINMPSVKSIASSAFEYCEQLASLSIGSSNSTTICTLESSLAFRSTPIESGTGYIYVPDALVDQYKSATNWSVYSNQIKGLSEKPAE